MLFVKGSASGSATGTSTGLGCEAICWVGKTWIVEAGSSKIFKRITKTQQKHKKW